jgi:hypothetical protein
MGWATFWAILSQKHPVTLLAHLFVHTVSFEVVVEESETILFKCLQLNLVLTTG